MSNTKTPSMPLKRLNDIPSTGERFPPNGVDTLSKERIQEAVKQANDPRRLVSEPPTHGNAWPTR
jgi:hypothetical protein